MNSVTNSVQTPSTLKQLGRFVVYPAIGLIAWQYSLIAGAASLAAYLLLSQEQVRHALSQQAAAISPKSIMKCAAYVGVVAALTACHFEKDNNPAKQALIKTVAACASRHFTLLAVIGGLTGTVFEIKRAGRNLLQATSLHLSGPALLTYQAMYQFPSSMKQILSLIYYLTDAVDRAPPLPGGISLKGCLLTVTALFVARYAIPNVQEFVENLLPKDFADRLNFFRYLINNRFQIPTEKDLKEWKALCDLRAADESLSKKSDELEKQRLAVIEERAKLSKTNKDYLAAMASGGPVDDTQIAKVTALTRRVLPPSNRKERIDRIVKTAQENIDKEKFVPGTSIRQNSSYNSGAVRTKTEEWLSNDLTNKEKADIMGLLSF